MVVIKVNTIEYYIELRFAFSTVADRTPVSVTLTQISETLHCSLRNARILLKKMDSEGFIQWTSGKGRGNQSHLTFTFPLSSVIILHFQSLIQQKRMEEAVQFLDRKEIPVDIKKKCYEHLRPHFGLHLPQIDEQKTPLSSKKMTLNHIVRQVQNRTSSWIIGKKMTKQKTIQWPTNTTDDD
jgi:MarR-like DNA-binding transcriptional regulator SgrR of sgrS sRNA